MTYTLYQGTRLGQALKEALEEMEEYEQISPGVRFAVLRKFDETMCNKLDQEVTTNLTLKADKLWSFRFCDSVWQLLLKNVEFIDANDSKSVVAKVNGKVKIVACDARKVNDKR